MRHARRLGAATLASSVSLLTTFGLAGAIRASEGSAAPATTDSQVNIARAASGSGGPSRLLVIRRSAPTGTSEGGTIYLQAPSTATAAVVAPAPAVPTTSSS